jgi:hypothetical protein
LVIKCKYGRFLSMTSLFLPSATVPPTLRTHISAIYTRARAHARTSHMSWECRLINWKKKKNCGQGNVDTIQTTEAQVGSIIILTFWVGTLKVRNTEYKTTNFSRTVSHIFKLLDISASWCTFDQHYMLQWKVRSN